MGQKNVIARRRVGVHAGRRLQNNARCAIERRKLSFSFSLFYLLLFSWDSPSLLTFLSLSVLTLLSSLCSPCSPLCAHLALPLSLSLSFRAHPDIIKTRPGLSKLASVVDKLPRISAALNGGSEDGGKTVDTLFAPTDKAIENFLQWTQAQNKTEEFAKILGNQTVAGAIVAYHVLPELVYKFGTLKEFDRKFINTALSNAVSDSSGAFALQIDEENGSIFVKGTGSEVKVIGADNYACNGIIHLVDGVLLPFDADGELSEKQKERLEDAKEMLSEAIEEEEEEEMEGIAPAPAPDAAFSIGLLTDLGLGGEAPAPSPSTSTTEIVEDIEIVEETTVEEASEEDEEDDDDDEAKEDKAVIEDEDVLQAELDEGDFNISSANVTSIGAANDNNETTD
jgi:uncharacterized surface protein with fasciclin (FAS1) repeats